MVLRTGLEPVASTLRGWRDNLFLQRSILQSGRIRSAYTSIPQGYTGSTTCFFTESKKTVLVFISRRTHSPPSKGCTLCAGCSRYGACSGDGEICTHSDLFVCDGFTDHSSSLTLAHPLVCTILAHDLFSCQAWTVRATIPPPPLCKSGALPNELTARRATTVN